MQSTDLKTALDARKAGWAEKASDEIKRIYTEGIEDVENSGILASAKQTGDIAPGFTLQNATGQEVSLSEYLDKGPVVLTWYRGGWCPYCNITLRYLQQALPDIQAAGAQLLALTPELPDKSLTTQEKNELSFEVLTDTDLVVAKKYGIVFKLIDEVGEAYRKNFSLAEFNGNDSDELPLAATYVIQPDGKITYAFLDAEYRNRAEPADILAAL
ncbi:MAG: AhpC/TSA family protein [Cyanothece sp. SIO1E1]|nr:AhpC/TSA family protein [Cyanothece sp. SIO1E1]